MSKNLVRKGADRQPDKKGLGLTAWLALIGFALLGAAELTGNQASLQMKPAVNLLYGKGLTDVLSSVSSWTVAGALLLISLGLASRLTDMQAVAGFGIMSSIYVVLGLFVLPGGVAITLAGLVGVFSVVIAFVRDAANRVAPDKPVAGNQIVSGGMVILSQFAPVGVAASGVTFGAQKTYLFVAIMLAGACFLGAFLFRRYPRPQADANVKTSHAWNAQSMRLTIINFISAVAVGAAFGPFFEDVHRRGLEQSTWVLIWGLAGTVVGFFLIFIWSRVTHGLRDRGLFIAALVTLLGAVFEVVEHHQAGGTALVAGGITVSLGANAFEASVYDRPTTPGENIVKNFGRALGFGLGAFFALRLVAGMQYAWLILGASLLGVLVTFMLRKHWVQPVAPEVSKDWRTKAAVVFGAGILALLTLLAVGVGIREIALILAGMVFIGAVIVGVLYIINWISAIGTRLNQTEARLNRAEERATQAEKQASQTETRLRRVQGELTRTRNIVGLPSVEAEVKARRAQLNDSLHEISNTVEERSEDFLQILTDASALITTECPTTEGLLEAGKKLQPVKSQIESLRKSFIGDGGVLFHWLREAFVALEILDQPLLHNWLMLHHARMWKAANTIRQSIDADLTSLQERLNGLETQRTEAMHLLRASLRAQNTVDNRSVRERQKDIKALNEALGED
jgi:hypothetical protein